MKIIANNRKATFHYEVLNTLEAGIMLTGTEVKSLRQGRMSLSDAYITDMNHDNELFILNIHIDEYSNSKYFTHTPKRPRKLLLKKRESIKWIQAIRQKGMTIIPLSMYFNDKNIVKLNIALCRGKNVIDKRKTIQDREWKREEARTFKRNVSF